MQGLDGTGEHGLISWSKLGILLILSSVTRRLIFSASPGVDIILPTFKAFLIKFLLALGKYVGKVILNRMMRSPFWEVSSTCGMPSPITTFR